MTNVTVLPVYNADNVAQALRQLANEIDADPGLCEHMVIAINGSNGITWRCFGKPPFSNMQALGLMEYAKAALVAYTL
jgi:hypothetical protein